MIYISKLLGQQVWDSYGDVIGKLDDILVSATELNMPPLAALRLKRNADQIEYVSAEEIASLWPGITLKSPRSKLSPYPVTGHELSLKDRVLDQQIVDIEGKRLVRVNDLQLARGGDQFYLTGVDVSSVGVLRRLGLESVGQRFSRVLGRPAQSKVIPWEFVASIEHDDPLRLSVSQNRLIKMLPADIATILDTLDRHTSHALLQGFDDESLADTLEESSTELQQAILSNLDPERAADVLEKMDPDEAADLLAEMSDDASEVLLDMMEADEAEEIRALLSFPEDTAGGIMTSEFAYVPDHVTAEEAIEYLRNSEDAQDDEVMYYVHILDDSRKLTGVVSLRDLVISTPTTQLDALKHSDPVTVDPYTPQQEVAYLISKYDLLSVPVVEAESGEMLGIVTVDDALDTVLPTAWKKRLPRFF